MLKGKCNQHKKRCELDKLTKAAGDTIENWKTQMSTAASFNVGSNAAADAAIAKSFLSKQNSVFGS